MFTNLNNSKFKILTILNNSNSNIKILTILDNSSNSKILTILNNNINSSSKYRTINTKITIIKIILITSINPSNTINKIITNKYNINKILSIKISPNIKIKIRTPIIICIKTNKDILPTKITNTPHNNTNNNPHINAIKISQINLNPII